MLTHEEAVRLKNEAPAELGRRALAERNEFLFAVSDRRSALGSEWGGEVRLLVNQNIVLHFVPSFNAEMRDLEELPQFVVFADDERDGEDRTHCFEGVKDLDPFDGVVFYVNHALYGKLVRELVEAAERYGDFPLLPDSLFAGSSFVGLVTNRVLDHPAVRAEREYDFSKRVF